MRVHVLIAILPMLLLYSCKSREARDQAASDTIAGADAMAALHPEYSMLAAGIANNALASRGKQERSELPLPSMSPRDIIEDQDSYLKKSEQNKDDAQGGTFWGWVKAGGIALLSLAGTVVARKTPVGGMAVNLISGWLESRATRRDKRKVQDLAGVGLKAIDVIENLPDDIGKPVKEAIHDKVKVSPEQESAIRAELERLAKEKECPSQKTAT